MSGKLWSRFGRDGALCERLSDTQRSGAPARAGARVRELAPGHGDKPGAAWTRRDFLQACVLTAASGVFKLHSQRAAAAEPAGDASVMTVRGPVPVSQLGRALTHEHIVTDFLGAARWAGPRYDLEAAVTTVRPHLEALKERGVSALFECTPQYIGRDVRLLRQLAEATGVHLVTNTGYYGAAGNKYIPQHAYEESAEELAERWLREWREGIDGTGIRPGFIKLGTDPGALSPLHEKLLRAAARVHRRTGLTICGHTGDGVAAMDQLRILASEEVAPEAFVWVHAQNGTDAERIEAARRGAWISLDGYSLAPGVPERYLEALLALKSAGCWSRVLVSHDDGWAVEGESPRQAPLRLFGNGNPQPYRSLFERLLPDLRKAGCTEADLDQLLRANPARAFGIRVRKLHANST